MISSTTHQSAAPIASPLNATVQRGGAAEPALPGFLLLAFELVLKLAAGAAAAHVLHVVYLQAWSLHLESTAPS